MYPNQSPFSSPSNPQQVSNPVPQQSAPMPPPQKSSRLWFILTFVLGGTTLIAAGLGIWALVTYFQERAAIETTVASAEAEVRREVVAEYEDKFIEFQKLPNATFAGPEDYGRLTFDYPRFWSVYVESDARNGGDYEAYFNPGAVPPISDATQLGLRVLIQDDTIERVLGSYESRVEDGELTSRALTINEETATRFDGNFSDDIRGSAVVFRIRDKTVTIRTDAQTFQADFDKLVGTIDFNR